MDVPAPPPLRAPYLTRFAVPCEACSHRPLPSEVTVRYCESCGDSRIGDPQHLHVCCLRCGFERRVPLAKDAEVVSCAGAS
jgi:RNase P subunit RPR2